MTPELSADDRLHFEIGRHYCAIFNSDKEWRPYVRALLQQALARHERFLYLYHNHTPAQIMSCLRRVAGAAAAFASGQALLAPATDAYYTNGSFDSDAILKSGNRALRQAHDDGYEGLVATGEVCACHEADPAGERFLQYEARLEAALTGQALTCVCQYDRRHLPAEFITEALLVHRYVLHGGRILPNHFYVAPERYLTKDRAENLLLARLEALRDWNEAEAPIEPVKTGKEIAGASVSGHDVTALEMAFEQVQAERSTVRQLADELQSVFAALNDCVLVLDKTGTCVRANPAAVRRYGFDPTGLSQQERMGRIKILHPDGREYLPDELHTVQALRGNDNEDLRCRFINANGEEFYLLAQAVPLRSGEAVVGAVLSWRDITETESLLDSLTEAQKQLGDSETLYRSIGELIPFGVWVCDPEGKPTYVSESYLAMTGLTLEELQADFARGYAAGQRPQLLDEWQKHAATGSVWDREFDVTGKDGNTYRILSRGIPLFTEEGVLRGWAGSSLDVTSRRREQEELQRHRDYLEDLVQQRTAELVEHRERLRLMASQVALAEEGERRRIATAIHDDLSQTLAFAKIRLAALSADSSSQALQGGLADLLTLMDDAIAASRTLTLELSPPVLYQMGFESALRWLGAHMASIHGYRVAVHIDKKPKPMGSDLEITLFQSAREILTNAAKYAACSAVEVSLRRPAHMVELTISDDGRGFDPAKVKTTVSSGFGLFSIRERLTYLGGELHIESARGKGCRVTLQVPVND